MNKELISTLLKATGVVMALYLFLVGISRFLIEFIREHQYLNTQGQLVESFNMFGLYGAQHISLIMIIAGIGFHYYLRLKK